MLVPPLDDNLQVLPSPQSLRFRILLKAKVHLRDAFDDDDDDEGEEARPPASATSAIGAVVGAMPVVKVGHAIKKVSDGAVARKRVISNSGRKSSLSANNDDDDNDAQSSEDLDALAAAAAAHTTASSSPNVRQSGEGNSMHNLLSRSKTSNKISKFENKLTNPALSRLVTLRAVRFPGFDVDMPVPYMCSLSESAAEKVVLFRLLVSFFFFSLIFFFPNKN